MSTEGPSPAAPRRPGRPPAGREPAPAPRPSGGGGSGRGPGDQQTLLGALLIGLAVVLGLVLLVKGFTGDEGSTGDETAASSTTLATEDPDAPPSFDAADTSTPVVTLPPSEVTVMVANAAGVSGAAGNVATFLGTLGYGTVDTTNAASTSTDQVFYAGDLQAEAEALASSLGLEPSAVAEMPEPPPVSTGDADILVMVGPNLASEDFSAAGSGSSTTAAGSATSTTAG